MPSTPPNLVPGTEFSYWHHAVRLAASCDPVYVLTGLVAACIELASRWDCTIGLSIEPDGDVSETGHFVEVGIEGSAVWADMSPWPGRFGGAIPARLHAELDLAGWLTVSEGADPDPIRNLHDLAEMRTPEQQESTELPVRRLVTFGDTGDLTSWSLRVAHAIERVLAPRSNRWYLTGSAEATIGGALAGHPSNRPGEFDGAWTVDLGQLLVPGDWVRAVWPSGSEGAYQACMRGLHQYHEPLCLPRSEGGDE